MGGWSFCRKCGWHSVGAFEKCLRCDSGDVHRFEEDLFMDAEGNFFANKEQKGESQSAGAAKEKNRRD
jgi:hypothetical protein